MNKFTKHEKYFQNEKINTFQIEIAVNKVFFIANQAEGFLLGVLRPKIRGTI